MLLLVTGIPVVSVVELIEKIDRKANITSDIHFFSSLSSVCILECNFLSMYLTLYSSQIPFA